MRVKSQKGSIAIFVLVALLFYMAFLLLLYANNLNKVQTITEKIETLKSIYAKNVENIDEVYNRQKGIQIGDYVNYDELSNGKKTYSVDYTQNGGTSSANNQTFETEDLGWRVLDIADNGQVTLISDNSTAATLYLRGENGYLNGEDILNNTCNELYGKGTYAESARNSNIEDIDTLVNYDKTKNSNYGSLWKYRFLEGGTNLEYATKSNSDWSEWGNIGYTAEINQKFKMPGESNIINSDNPGETEELEYTRYSYKISAKDINEMIGCNNSANVNYWLSSGAMGPNKNCASFSIWYVSGGYVSSMISLYASNEDNEEYNRSLRPVVTLNSNVQLVKDTATDTWNIQ